MNSLGITDVVRQQYERFPYPPVPSMALPGKGQGEPLRYERAGELGRTGLGTHAGKRILVAGCGTIEALVVAQMHPLAKEIVAVDASERSIARLRRRFRWARGRNIALPHRRMKLPKVELKRADLFEFEAGEFDYIVATDVLHHTADPGGLLCRLAGMLAPGGILRLATYPKASRVWMRAASKWLGLHGIDPSTKGLRSEMAKAMGGLPESHPVRTCYMTHQEIETDEGAVDAFLHSLENPLRPFEWARAAENAGLGLFAEDQAETSRGEFLVELYPGMRKLGAWDRLQVMDDLLELCANPVLWFVKGEASAGEKETQMTERTEIAGPKVAELDAHGNFNASEGNSVRSLVDKLKQSTEAGTNSANTGISLTMPSMIRAELGGNLRRAEEILIKNGLDLQTLLDALKREVGPRVAPPPNERELLGMSIGEYPAEEIMSLPSAWTRKDWHRLERALNRPHRIRPHQLRSDDESGGENAEGPEMPRELATLADQAEYFQLLYGAEKSWITGLTLAPATGR